MKSAPRLTSEMVAEVMVQGRALKSGSFLFKYIYKEDPKTVENKENANNLTNKAYFGFIASKKIFPDAVLRNKARRRGRAALQKALKPFLSNKIISHNPISSINAFILNKEALTIDLEKLAMEIEQVLIKSGILVKL